LKVLRRVPWKSILTSVPLWAATSISCCYGWTYVVMLSMTPTYLTTMLGYDIRMVTELVKIMNGK
jgi:hypothetical protein